MKEHPIIFSGDLVKALLAGTKTQTRRIINPQPNRQHHICLAIGRGAHNIDGSPQFEVRTHYARSVETITCPYGIAGDRLYVRETHWRYGRWVKNGKTETGRQRWKFLCHRSSSISFVEPNPLTHEKRINPKRGSGEGWYKRPSIFMPKWAARIWLEILKVRVERVQDISSDDCIAEGVGLKVRSELQWGSVTSEWNKRAYSVLWNSLHGKGAWERNDWVWCLDFKKL